MQYEQLNLSKLWLLFLNIEENIVLWATVK